MQQGINPKIPAPPPFLCSAAAKGNSLFPYKAFLEEKKNSPPRHQGTKIFSWCLGVLVVN
jgi:hypothetical protein